MKKHPLIKTSILQLSTIAILLVSASCDTSPPSTDTKIVAKKVYLENFNSDTQKNNALFLVNAAEINLQEIQLGLLAQQKGSAAHIKELGKQMESAHTKSQNDLIALTRKKQVTIPVTPTDNARNAYKKLYDKSGNEFDQMYADMMIKGHQDAIDAFEDASFDNKDIDVKNWINASLVDLRRDLDQSMDSHQKLQNMTFKKKE